MTRLFFTCWPSSELSLVLQMDESVPVRSLTPSLCPRLLLCVSLVQRRLGPQAAPQKEGRN